MKFEKYTWLAALIAAGLMGTACGPDDDDDTEPTEDVVDDTDMTDTGVDDDTDVTEPDPSGITGTFHFGGEVEGLLRVAIFSEDPSTSENPTGAIVNIISAENNGDNDLVFDTELDPGDYWLLLAQDLEPIGLPTDLDLEADLYTVFDANPMTLTTYDPVVVEEGVMTELGTIEMGGGVISGTLTYEGAEDGDVLIALFTELPPASAPAAATILASPFAEGTTTDFVLGGISDAENLFVIAGIDVGNDNIAAPELVGFYPMPLTFGDEGRMFEDIDIEIPNGIGTVSGTVQYDGEEPGGLTVALFTEFPPPEGEAPAAYEIFDAPTEFPADFELEWVPAGDYTLAALYYTDDDDNPDIYDYTTVSVSEETPDHTDLGLVLPSGTSTISGTVSYDVHTAGELIVAAFTELPSGADATPVAAALLGEISDAGTVEYTLERLDEGTYYVLGLFDFLPDEVNAGPELFGLSTGTPVMIETNGDALTGEDIDLVAGPGAIGGNLQVINDGAEGMFMVAAYEGTMPSADDDAVAIAGPFVLDPESGFQEEAYEMMFLPTGDYSIVAAYFAGMDPTADPDRLFLADEIATIADETPVAIDVQAAIGTGNVSGTISYMGSETGALLIYGLAPVGDMGPDFENPIWGDFVPFDMLAGGPPATYDYMMNFTPHADAAVPMAGIDLNGDLVPEILGTGDPIMIGDDAVTEADIDIYDPLQAYCGTMAAVCAGTFADDVACGVFMGTNTSSMGLAGDTEGDTQNCYLTYALMAKGAAEAGMDPTAACAQAASADMVCNAAE